MPETKDFWRKARRFLFSFNGRTGRAGYFLSYLCLMPLGQYQFRALQAAEKGEMSSGLALLFLLWGWLIIWIACAIFGRRLHDMNLRGWWMLLMVPLVIAYHQGSSLVTLLLCLVPGTDGPNRFGDAPPTPAQMLAAHKIDALSKRLAEGKISTEEFNKSRAEILAAEKKD